MEDKYIEYFEDVFLIEETKRFDIKGRKYISGYKGSYQTEERRERYCNNEHLRFSSETRLS